MEWISNLIQYFMIIVIIYPVKLIHVCKRDPSSHNKPVILTTIQYSDVTYALWCLKYLPTLLFLQ